LAIRSRSCPSCSLLSLPCASIRSRSCPSCSLLCPLALRVHPVPELPGAARAARWSPCPARPSGPGAARAARWSPCLAHPSGPEDGSRTAPQSPTLPEARPRPRSWRRALPG
jgi:hypothetical protein